MLLDALDGVVISDAGASLTWLAAVITRAQQIARSQDCRACSTARRASHRVYADPRKL